MRVISVKTEIEFNLSWAEQNTALFTGAINDIAKEYSYLEYKHSIDFSRKGFVTITCTRRADARRI
jgi:hypothetical protein